MPGFNFTPFPNLSTRRLLLRQLSPGDIHEIFLLRTDEDVNRHLDRPVATTLEEAGNFIQKINDGISRNENIYWAICIKDDARLVGTIGLWNLSGEQASAEIGYELLPAFQGKGIMQEALSKVLEYGFQTMQLRTIEASLSERNERSIRILEKNQFKRDAEAEACMPAEEKTKGMIIYSLYSHRLPDNHK